MLLPAALQINIAARQPGDAMPHTTRATLQRLTRRIYRNILPLFSLVILCVLVNSPLVLVGLVVLPFVLIVRWFALGSPLPLTRVNLILLVFGGAVLANMLRAPYWDETGLDAARIVVSITLLFLILDYAESPSRLWNVAAGLAAFGGIVAVFALILTEPAPEKILDVSALFHPGLFGLEVSNPNMIAGALAAILPLALVLIFNGRGQARVIGSVSFPPMFIMVLLLQARGAWIAALVGVLIFLSLYRRLFLIFIPIVVFGLVLISAFAADIQAALPFPVNLNISLATLEGRQQVWRFAATQIVREPLGHGINSFTLYAENLAGDLLTTPQRQHAHNLFLQVGFETGLVGLGAFAALCAYALYASWHAVTRHVKRELASAIFAGLCASLGSSLLEANMWGNRAAFVLWTLFAMALVLGRYGARRRHRQRGRSLEQESAG